MNDRSPRAPRSAVLPSRSGPAPDRITLEDLSGRSAAFQNVLETARRAARTGPSKVLIDGESGTGKGALARAIHGSSERCEMPFVEVHCAGIPSGLLEGELFGFEPGAFTDARERKPGLFELADRGTLHLDEIGETTLSFQAKLLKFLDTRRIRRLAGREEIPLDLRVIVSTGTDLLERMRSAAFRPDLYYRLDVLRLRMPPLRDRGDDILILAERFASEISRRLGREAPRMAPDARTWLRAQRWPGNIRELANTIERAILLHPGPTLGRDAFPPDGATGSRPTVDICSGEVRIDLSRGPISLSRVERRLVESALAEASGNVSGAARLLGLGRGAFRTKLRKHGLEASAGGGNPRKAARSGQRS